MDKRCNHQGNFDCKQMKVDGFEYCKEHILEDKTAPFRLCTYLLPSSGRRCINLAIKKDGSGLCEEHLRKGRQLVIKRYKPPPTAESLLVSLAHYAKIEKKSVNSSFETNLNDEGGAGDASNDYILQNTDHLDTNEGPESSKQIDPFVDIDAFRVNSAVSRVMDYASESESDPEPIAVSNLGDSSDGGSEIEGIDEKDDILRHAGIYSAEEVTQITKDKLIRLQSLYIEQFRRLQHTLRERRRSYLQSLKKEKETLSSIHSQPKDTPKERKIYEKLKSLNRYHKRNGVEAVLHKKSLEKRAEATDGINVRQAPVMKCIHTEDGIRCLAKTFPSSKFCGKHILADGNQSLYRACGATQGGFPCSEPVLNVFDNVRCVFHTEIPPLRKPRVVESAKCVPSATVVRQMYPEATAEPVCDRSKVNSADNIENRLIEIFGESEDASDRDIGKTCDSEVNAASGPQENGTCDIAKVLESSGELLMDVS